jgi:hypothetical protein
MTQGRSPCSSSSPQPVSSLSLSAAGSAGRPDRHWAALAFAPERVEALTLASGGRCPPSAWRRPRMVARRTPPALAPGAGGQRRYVVDADGKHRAGYAHRPYRRSLAELVAHGRHLVAERAEAGRLRADRQGTSTGFGKEPAWPETPNRLHGQR